MPESERENESHMRRILGRVGRAEFVGRAVELSRIASHPVPGSRGLLILLAPTAGVSELLRQGYDEIFNRRGDVAPVYFSIPRGQATAVTIAIEFLNTFLLQYLAFRRDDPTLCQAPLVLSDLVKLAPAPDYDWIDELLNSYNRIRFGANDQELVRLCFSAPDRVPRANGRVFVMLDLVHAGAGHTKDSRWLRTEMLRTLNRSAHPYLVAGLRRQILSTAHEADLSFETLQILRLDELRESDAGQLTDFAAARQQVRINDESRDLLVQQFERSPFFITTLLQAAREKNISLDSFLACERLYVDELLGGHIHQYFTGLLEQIAPSPELRCSLIKHLYEATLGSNARASFEVWRKLLTIAQDDLELLLDALHTQEFVNWDGGLVEAGGGPTVWKDFLWIRYRLDVQNEFRAQVVAEMIARALKRAPQTMASRYRRAAKLKLKDLLVHFNYQLVPRILLDYELFKESYRGATTEEISAGLDAETDLVRLPQVFHAALCSAYNRRIAQLPDDESCVIAHAFEGSAYSDDNEIVWLAAQIDSKLEVEREVAELWCERLEALAACCGFARTRLFLIANEGFSTEASRLLEHRGGHGVSRQQVELLTARLGEFADAGRSPEPDEFVAILPMGDDNELVAANIVEQIARRSNFGPEAINQIKTAIVEACINAAEHSLSPDRKIYQRFRVESDKLVITISSRGLVPSRQATGEGTKAAENLEPTEGRRGWGLKLIRSLMDEVEFERVDDGTSLRMTKYLRSSPS
ncbi:MAG TPA: ATP-binding protein [Pyrinomonadaceae bacterium]|nr:ATP-binding protein [Pyrinomonadaceae bacterium]